MSPKYLFLPLASLFFLGAAHSLAFEAPAPKLTVAVDKHSEEVPRETYSAWTKHELSMAVAPSYRSEIENPLFCPAESRIICGITLSTRTASGFQKKSTPVFNRQAAESFLEDLARRTDSEATDAKFKVENGKITAFEPEQSGTKLDVEKSLAILEDFTKNGKLATDKNALALPYTTTRPSVTMEQINSMGITELIGEGRSNFRGSPRNRIHNIKAAIRRFDGALIKPGEEFSFVQILGEVDEAHGYLPELVIKQGTTTPEFGGGICQVSTTVFRAAIYAGLEITARRNHAYPVSYYNPQGMDSTIYVPRPDLRFKNNTPGHILVQPRIENGTELVVSFYGTSDGRKVEVDGPHITESNPDKSIKTRFTQKVTDRNGNVLIDDVFNSSYDSPYKYPHPGDQKLAAKPANWSEDEWKAYKTAFKEMEKAVAKNAKNAAKPKN